MPESLVFNKVAGGPATLLKKESLVQVFFCKFCKISKKTSSYRTPPVTAFGISRHGATKQSKTEIIFNHHKMWL